MAQPEPIGLGAKSRDETVYMFKLLLTVVCNWQIELMPNCRRLREIGSAADGGKSEGGGSTLAARNREPGYRIVVV